MQLIHFPAYYDTTPGTVLLMKNNHVYADQDLYNSAWK